MILPSGKVWILIIMGMDPEIETTIAEAYEKFDTAVNLKTESDAPMEPLDLPLDAKCHLFPALENVLSFIEILEAAK